MAAAPDLSLGARERLAGVDFDVLTTAALLGQVASALRRGQGGTIVTPNVDICRRAAREPRCGALIARASLVVPDGMPLLWAARIAGRPLPERITGADLIFSLCERAAAGGWPVFLLGGVPAADGGSSAAELAAGRLSALFPGLIVAGAEAPPVRLDPAAADLTGLRARLAAGRPGLVFVGLGFPKQELLIERLAPELPGAWFVGCGSAIRFAAGEVRRAPAWMQCAGLEWCHRLISEPGRLVRRYLIDDLPFALRLLAGASRQRLARHW